MQTEVLVSSKERIKNILESRPADRIGILDKDLEFYSSDRPKASDKFYLFSFNGPFQCMSSKLGLEDALIKFTQEPRHARSDFKEYHKRAVAEYMRLKKEGRSFDGAWIWEDIAYDKGLYFPIEKYRKQLLPMHRDTADFFAAEGLPLFFHCDGNIGDLIPLLAGIKIKAIHPMQERCNREILRIKDIFRGVITFIGGVGLHRLSQERSGILERIAQMQEGGNYIFSFDGPLPAGFDKGSYNELLKEIEAQGI